MERGSGACGNAVCHLAFSTVPEAQLHTPTLIVGDSASTLDQHLRSYYITVAWPSERCLPCSVLSVDYVFLVMVRRGGMHCRGDQAACS
jgi:hypothetical protein